MSYSSLAPFIISFGIFFSFLWFLTKRFPDHFPKEVLFSYKTFLFFILEIFLLYSTITFFLFSQSSVYVENGVNCYKGFVRFENINHSYDTCLVILNNFSQTNFLYFSILASVLFIFIMLLFSRGNSKFINMLFKNVDLIKEEKETQISKGFIITITIITLIVLMAGYILFNNIDNY